MPTNTTTRIQNEFLPGSSLSRINSELLTASGIVVLTAAQYTALNPKQTGTLYVVTDGSFTTPAGLYIVYPLVMFGEAPSATQGLAYSFTPTVVGGEGVKTFSLVGSLPSGLSLNTSTGTISGTPTVSGPVATFSITVSDNSGSVTTEFTIGKGTIGGPIPFQPITYEELMANYRYGVNLAGLEFGGEIMPGTVYSQVRPQPPATYNYVASVGARLVRLTGLWERIQPDLNGPLGSTLNQLSTAPGFPNAPEANYLYLVRNQFLFAKAAGVKILWDPMHNYGARALKVNGTWVYEGGTGREYAPGKRKFAIGSADVPISAYADAWSKIAALFAPGGYLYDVADVLAGLDLMNEPVSLPNGATTLTQMYQAAITAIRNTGYKGMLFVEGYVFSSTGDWKLHNPTGTLETLNDPLKNLVASGHNYLDANHSGTYTNTEATKLNYGQLLNKGAQELVQTNSVKSWFDTLPAGHSYKGIHLGETNAPNTPEWQEALRLELVAARDAGYMVNIWATWPNTYGNQNQTDNVLNVLPFPFASGPTRTVATLIGKLTNNDPTITTPVGLGQVIVPNITGTAGGIPQMDSGGSKVPAVVSNLTAGATTNIAVKSSGTTIVNLPVTSAGLINGSLPTNAGTYDLEVTQTLGTLTYTQTFTGKAVVAAGASSSVVPASILVDSMDSLTDPGGGTRTAQGGGTVLTVDTARKVQGTGSVNVNQTSPANATIGVNTAGNGSHDPTTLDVMAYYEDYPTDLIGRISNHAINVTRSPNLATVTFNQSDTAYPGGDWIAFAISELPNSATFLGTGVGPLAYSHRVSQNSPYGASASFDGFIKQAKGMPTFIINYDDIPDSQYNNAYPLHVELGVPATFFVPRDFIGRSGRMTDTMLTTMYGSGIIDFGCDSTPDDTAINLTDADAALAQVTANRDFLISKGWTRNNTYNHLCYANNAHNNLVAQKLQDNGFGLMRTTIPGLNYSKHGFGKGRAKRIFSHPSTSANTYDSYYKALIDRCMLIGGTMSMHMHGVSVDGTNDTRPAELRKVLERIKAEVDAGKAVAMTYGQVFNRDGFTTSFVI